MSKYEEPYLNQKVLQKAINAGKDAFKRAAAEIIKKNIRTSSLYEDHITYLGFLMQDVQKSFEEDNKIDRQEREGIEGLGYKEKGGEDWDVVYEYGDRQAIEDGILADISSLRLSFHGKPINRMTSNLWNKMEPFFVEPNKMQKFKQAIQTKLILAKRAGEPGDEYMFTLLPNIWMVMNEVGGYTLMLPEDY